MESDSVRFTMSHSPDCPHLATPECECGWHAAGYMPVALAESKLLQHVEKDHGFCVHGDVHVPDFDTDLPPSPCFGSPEGHALADEILKAAVGRINARVRS